jgi:hypothetical protein
MEFLTVLDAVCKGMATAFGLGLIGLLLFRVNPRGKVRLAGFEAGPVFAPGMARTGGRIACAFAVCVGIWALRAIGGLL